VIPDRVDEPIVTMICFPEMGAPSLVSVAVTCAVVP
jgi:hypothetical protein